MYCLKNHTKKLFVLAILILTFFSFHFVLAENIVSTTSLDNPNKTILTPDQIIVVKISPLIADESKFIKSTNVMFMDNMKLSQNLFSYIAIKDNVYKMHDIDAFSSNTDKKIAYIAYTENVPLQLISNLTNLYNISKVTYGTIKYNNSQINIDGTEALSDKLPLSKIEYNIKLDNSSYSYDVDPSTSQTVQVKFKDISPYPILKSDQPKLFIVSLKDDKESPSDMYLNDDWYSKTRSGKMEQDRVSFNESGTMNFSVYSNVIAGIESQKFAFANSDGSIIPDSQFDLNLNVKDIKQKIVQIKANAGYGFFNIRDEKIYNGRVVAFANSGTKLLVTQDDGSWVKVRYESNKEGWIQSAYVTKLY